VSQCQEDKTNLDLAEARDNGSVTVASAGSYASLHFTPHQHPTTAVVLNKIL